jgi:hypothetical protein
MTFIKIGIFALGFLMLTACSQFGHLAEYERDVTNSPLGQEIVGKWFRTKVETRAYQAGTPQLYVRPYVQLNTIFHDDGTWEDVPAPYKYLLEAGTYFQVIGVKVKSSHVRQASKDDRVCSFNAIFYPKGMEPFEGEANYLFKPPLRMLRPNSKFSESVEVGDEPIFYDN